jgi:predicted GH43/DUF377 family glycosyl hydrolase
MPVIIRYKNNPILTKKDVPFEVHTVHNGAVTRYGDKTLMVFRSHLSNGRSILGLAESRDGYHFTVRDEPFMVPSTSGVFKEYEAFGIEDPRITKIENRYFITYSAYSKHGVRIGLASTEDFMQVKRIEMITQADHRNVVLFPETFNGLYARLDRPHSEITPWSIWVSFSPDLKFWGKSQLLFKPLEYHWDQMKIGPGPPPIKTPQGWLVIYHGVFPTMDGSVYRLGVALLDLNDPTQVVGIGDRWILQPEETYEVTGYVHNVVFSCGAIDELDGTIKIYWGGADSVMCVGTATTEELVQFCLKDSRPPC